MADTACTSAHVKLMTMIGVTAASVAAIFTVAVVGWFADNQDGNFDRIDNRMGELVTTFQRAEDQRIEVDNRLTDAIIALELKIIERPGG